ncbi:MAG: glycosyl hydrolase family 28 protein [Thermoguttaceae bacterium]|jgi:alpha-tubulin suppressor-like RCC1 family protein|nr:glycosyl hydrolase family 28 protein [Thermoguttaceae bacterium]
METTGRVLTAVVLAIALLNTAGAAANRIAAGSRHSVVLDEDGGLLAWGDGRMGQLGNGQFANADRPVAVAGPDGEGRLAGVVAVSAGMYHTLAICEDGSVWAWGNNTFGQLGNGSWGHLEHSALPVQVVGPGGEGHLKDVVAISAGWDHSVALLNDGTVWAWGSRCHGQLGDGLRDSNRLSPHPVHVLGLDGRGMLSGVKALACGAHHTVALREDGTLLAWGGNHDGQLGSGRLGAAGPQHGTWPAPVVGPDGNGALDSVSAVAAGYYHTVALRQDGSVWTWGYNGTGQLGHGTRESVGDSRDLCLATPAQMIGGRQGGKHLAGIVAVAAGYENTYALDSEGRVWACGWNVYGGLGMGTGPIRAYSRARMQPVSKLVEGDFEPIAGRTGIAAGAYHALAAGAEGEFSAWGHNGFGQLGDGTRQDREAAVRVAAIAPDFVPGPATGPRGQAPPSPAVKPHFSEPDPEGEGVFNVRKGGAIGDGVQLDQYAIQAVIDAAHEVGGGIVLVPKGVYRTGTLHLKCGVRLHLAESAILLGSTNRDHYEPRAMIVAEDAEGIAITGIGTIDGSGQFCPNRGWRHNIIRMNNCTGVTVEGIATNNAGSWTQHYIRCKNLTLRNIRLNSIRPGRNNDGLDFTGCEDVLIEGCTVVSDDDCIVIKSTRAEHVNRNIRAVNNVVYAFASGFKLGTETRGVFENIVCDNLHVYGGTTLGLYSVDGPAMRGVRVSNVYAESSRCAFGVRLGARLRESYFGEGEQRVPGSMENVELRDLDIRMADRPWREVLLEHGIENAEMAHQLRVRPVVTSFISGLPGHPIRNVLLENVRIVRPGGYDEEQVLDEVSERPTAYPAAGMFGELPAWGIYLRHAQNVSLRKLRLELSSPDARPPLLSENLAEDDLVIENLSVQEVPQ